MIIPDPPYFNYIHETYRLVESPNTNISRRIEFRFPNPWGGDTPHKTKVSVYERDYTLHVCRDGYAVGENPDYLPGEEVAKTALVWLIQVYGWPVKI